MATEGPHEGANSTAASLPETASPIATDSTPDASLPTPAFAQSLQGLSVARDAEGPDGTVKEVTLKESDTSAYKAPLRPTSSSVPLRPTTSSVPYRENSLSTDNSNQRHRSQFPWEVAALGLESHFNQIAPALSLRAFAAQKEMTVSHLSKASKADQLEYLVRMPVTAYVAQLETRSAVRPHTSPGVHRVSRMTPWRRRSSFTHTSWRG